ncbi:hypothetical protein GUITHDRAFT_108916 [Guillardia theta CCMP2712]|uniref:Uncharacterized protein n=1 Tax=Guillardia theta (strain CCMP2712) TaxID=905079 RepID=L1JB11_GUITC|nr:hypothetical protein GUITHDRAFT_108916 [Guillardia theta CCMP2712]EKX45274.1 hypothetical protein GUITHDRAFT_108916 [Guillardia theta CCMP2712]|eukprot:XP_005832254.1 hypothetical protein GUITHDRAFT_108916 [Guillardia theta CCMP2712]
MFREYLLKVAKTTLSSKIVHVAHDHFAEICVDAVLRLKGSGNLENIQILKKAGGSMRDSFLAPGFILDKKIGVGQPKRVENAKILIANTPMDTDKIKIYGAKVKVDSLSKVAEIEQAEAAKMVAKCDKIMACGCNVFINRHISPESFPYFADRGVMAIEHGDSDGIQRLFLVPAAPPPPPPPSLPPSFSIPFGSSPSTSRTLTRSKSLKTSASCKRASLSTYSL